MANPIIFGCRVNASGASGIGVRASGNGTLLFSDVSGNSASLKVEANQTLSIYATQYETVVETGTLAPLFGDRSAWDVDDYSIRHASDINAGLPVYHNPVPTAAGQAPVSNASLKYVATDITTQGELDAHALSPAAHHAPVMLAADADTLLGLSSQQLSLDAQEANKVFAGPASGGAADPTFRALVEADLPGGSAGGSGHVHGLTRWEGAAAQTNFELPDVAEYVDWVADNGLMFDPGEDYSLDADGDTIVLTSGLAEAAVITAGYVIAQV